MDSLPANPTFPRERKFQNKCRCPVAALKSIFSPFCPTSIAIPFKPILSGMEDTLYVSLSTNSIFAIDAFNGDVLWGVTREEANPSSSVLISPDDLLVYATWVG